MKSVSKKIKRRIQCEVVSRLRLDRDEICAELQEKTLELVTASDISKDNVEKIYIRDVYGDATIAFSIACVLQYKGEFFYFENRLLDIPMDILASPHYHRVGKEHIKTDLKNIDWDEEELKDQLVSMVEGKLPDAIRRTLLRSNNPDIEHLQPLLAGEIFPYQKAISASVFAKYYNFNCIPQLKQRITDTLAKAAKKRKDYYAVCIMAEFSNEKENDSVSLKIICNLCNDYIHPKEFIYKMTFKLKLTEDMEELIKNVDAEIEEALPTIISRIWQGEFPEKYDLQICHKRRNESATHAFVDDLITDTLEPYSSGFKSEYITCSIKYSMKNIYIEKKEKGFYICLPVGEDIPLKPSNGKLMEQHVVANYYNVMTSPKKQPIPANMMQWCLFSQYLSQVYERVLSKKKMKSQYPRIQVNVNTTVVTVIVVSYQARITPRGITFQNNTFPTLEGQNPDNAYDLADAIIRQAIMATDEANKAAADMHLRPIEAKILSFLRDNPNSSITFICSSLKTADVLAKSYPYYIQKLLQEDVISAKSVTGTYVVYEAYYVTPKYVNVPFDHYVTSYTLEDVPYLNANTQKEIIKREFERKSLKLQQALPVFDAMWRLSKKAIEELCQDEVIRSKIFAMPARDIDFIRTMLCPAVGDKTVQKIFAERDYQQLEELAASVTQCRVEKIADMIMEVEPQTVNTFFKEDIGTRFLAECKPKQLEYLADALFCADGCKTLYKRVEKMLQKEKK